MQSSLFTFNETQILAFALILFRTSAFIVAWPIFGTPLVPNIVKILFSLVLALALYPVVQWQSVSENLGSSLLLPLVVREVFIGLCLGFLARMFFYAVSVSGQIISLSFGLTGSQLLNPTFSEYSTVIDQFQVLLATLFFLSINGHHMLISALSESFTFLPLGVMDLNFEIFASTGGTVQKIIEMGLRMSAPVMVAILMTNVVMAIMGRAVPQVNVLITSIPVNILVGLGVLIVSMPLLIGELSELLNLTGTEIFRILKGL